MLAISWTTAAFGEEVLFRDFLQGHLRDWLCGAAGAGVLSAALQAVLFGLGHACQAASVASPPRCWVSLSGSAACGCEASGR